MAALPRLVDHGIAVEAGEGGEVLDRPVASEHLDPPVGHVGGGDRGEVLVGIDEEPVGGGLGLRGLIVVEAVKEAGEGHRRGQRRLFLDLHDRQLLTHGGERPDGPTEGQPVACESRGLQVGAPHDAGRSHRIEPPRGVEQLLHRHVEPFLDRSDGPAECAVEVDLRRGQASRPELVLEPPDSEAVGGAIDAAGDEEAPQSACARCCALGAGGQREQVGVGHRAEPLLSRDPPRARLGRVRDGGRDVGADVRPSLDLGEELRPAQAAVVVGLEDAR